jgi:superfamily II DNA or RNA helicase
VQLQDHQQRISDRVTGEDPRMLVYHGLGSGKSLSALAAAEAARKLHGDSYGIVVPASLRGNFQKEVKKFTQNSEPEIMSYTGLGMGKQFKDTPETLIMDEAARLRNPDSAMTQAAMRAARNAKRVMLLTGTPITNAPGDLAPLLSMLQGKNIDPKSFTDRYVGYKKVKPGWGGWLRGIQPGDKPYVKNEAELRELLKGRVDYQPSKTPEGVNVNEEVLRVPMSDAQKKIQQAIRTKIPPGFLWKLDQEFPMSRDELSRLNGFLTGMRQVGLSTQPFRADKNPLKAFDQSAKLTTAMKNLRTVIDSDPRKKALIYSNFVDAGLNPYAAALERDKIPYGVFHGGIPTKQRQQALNDYNTGKLRALLLGPAAAEGISTKGTSLIQLLDPHWNESRLQQAKGRGLRFDSHADLPEELKNVAVQRYLNQSETPSFLKRKLLGKKRERTADEILERLTADKEQFNEQFRNLLRDVGTPKTAGARVLANNTTAPAQPAPPPQPVAPQIVGKPVEPIVPGYYAGGKDHFRGSRGGAPEWLARNYSAPGTVFAPSRQIAHKNIWDAVKASPGGPKRYQTETANLFNQSQQKLRRPTEIHKYPRLPLAASATTFGDGGFMTPEQRAMATVYGLDLSKPGVHLGTFDSYVGQPSLGNALYRGLGLMRDLPKMPSLNRNIIGLHELEHAKQDVEDIIGIRDITQSLEPPAVMAETVNAAEAARRAARKPVSGTFPLTPTYQPNLEWMRQQAEQHGYETMGGDKTMTELLNTPAGQAWLRMQYNELDPDF